MSQQQSRTTLARLYQARSRGVRSGFTLVELLTVVAIVGLIGALLLPVFSASKSRAQGVICMQNLRQLQVAWSLYHQDNEDWLPGVRGGWWAGPGAWVSGWMDFSTSPDNTNTLYLTSPDFSQLAQYVKGPEVFHCPSDKSTVTINGRTHPRVRSVSMSAWMNYIGKIVRSDIGQDSFVIFRKFGDILEPSPSRAWVLIDERQDSINDGMFTINLKARRLSARIVDYPGSYHNGAAGISFADGHAEMRRWLDPRTTPALKPSQLINLDVPSPDNPDVAWLQERSSAHKDRPD